LVGRKNKQSRSASRERECGLFGGNLAFFGMAFGGTGGSCVPGSGCKRGVRGTLGPFRKTGALVLARQGGTWGPPKGRGGGFEIA